MYMYVVHMCVCLYSYIVRACVCMINHVAMAGATGQNGYENLVVLMLNGVVNSSVLQNRYHELKCPHGVNVSTLILSGPQYGMRVCVCVCVCVCV